MPSAAPGRPDQLTRARAYLRAMPPAISGSGGHTATFNAARKIADLGLSEKEIFDLLTTDYNPTCSPPWSPEELAHKAREAVEKRKPRPVEDREPVWSAPDLTAPPDDGWADHVPEPESEVRSQQPGAPSDNPGREVETTRPKVRTLAERLAATKALGPKIPTGISALDEHLRGGFRAQKLMVIGGAPGAGKTTLLVQIGRFLARSGIAVGFLAIDEEAAGIDARNLESIGIDRDKAEEPDAATIQRAVDELGELPFVVFEECFIEDVFEEMARRYPNHQRAVLIDSIQTARTRQSEVIEAIRERITDTVHTAKRFARAPGTEAMCFGTSELARGAYRSRQSAEQIEDLAAFKESGAVEYQAHVLLVLRTIKGESDLVSASIPKNRMGTKGTFGLRLDFSRATFSVEDIPEEDEGDREEAKVASNAARVAKDARDLANVILHKPGLGERDLRTALRSAGHTWGRDRLDAAKQYLKDGRGGSILVNRGNDRGSAWFVQPVSEGDL